MKRFLLVLAFVLLSAVPSQAAVAFRSIASSATATGAEPSGAAQDDILIAVVYKEADTTANTAPAGWSNSFNGSTVTSSLTNQVYRADAYWIRRGASAPALIWTVTGSCCQIVIAAYSGARTSGDPFSFGASAVRDDATAQTWPALSGTTTDANEMLVWVGNNFQGGTTSSPPTGFTEELDIGGIDTAWADLIQVGAGGTGSITGATVTAGGANGPQNSFLMGLRPAGGSPPACTPTLSLLGVGRCG